MDNGTLPARINSYNCKWNLGIPENSIMLPPIEELGRPGEVTFTELCLLAHIVKRYNVKRFFEIGTFKGTTTLVMATNMGPDGHAYTLDTPVVLDRHGYKDKEWCKPEKVGEAFRDAPEHTQRITQLWGDSRYFDFSYFFGKMDMVFVDGDHNYDTTVSELTNALKMVKPGGIIVNHDFSVWWPDILYAVSKIANDIGKPIYTFAWTTLAMFGDGLDKLFND